MSLLQKRPQIEPLLGKITILKSMRKQKLLTLHAQANGPGQGIPHDSRAVVLLGGAKRSLFVLSLEMQFSRGVASCKI